MLIMASKLHIKFGLKLPALPNNLIVQSRAIQVLDASTSEKPQHSSAYCHCRITSVTDNLQTIVLKNFVFKTLGLLPPDLISFGLLA